MRIKRVKHDAWNHYSQFIIKQIERISANRDGRQAMRITTQCADKIAVSHHLTDTTVVLIKHCSTDDDAMLHGIGNIDQIFRRNLNSINI